MSENPDREYVMNSKQLQEGWCNVPAVLAQLGFDDLREGQRPVICNLLAGVDTICVLPTSGGKTATFVIPTLALGWKTIVFSPLLALIRDQVQSLQKKRIPSAAITSMQSAGENKFAMEEWAKGNISFLYVAPERLHNAAFKAAMDRQNPDLVVVDEAHCISQWSDNFRSSYCETGPFIAEYNPKAVMACTATCNTEVEEDVRRVLGIPNAKKLIYFPRRENLKLQSRDLNSDKDIANVLMNEIDGSAIVYCSTVARTEEMASFLGRHMKEDVIHFHGQLNDSDKKNNMDMFMSDRIRVVCATNAFGMGVDKPNIRGVIHRDIPGSIEALSQELGRAGRDGEDSECITFLSKDSLATQKFFIETANPSSGEIQRVFTTLKNASDMDGYLEMTGKQISQKTGVSTWKQGTIMEILKSNGVIERIVSNQKHFKVRPTYPLLEDERFETWWGYMEMIGLSDDKGFFLVDMDSLVDMIGLSEPTVKNWLKKWNNAGNLRYVPPFSGTPTKVVGRLADIDFDRLEKKAKEATEKLELVLKYCNMPDEDKHKFLEDYFEIK